MIRIARSGPGPKNLRTWGDRQTAKDCAEYDAQPSEFHTGGKKFKFKNYYSKDPVKVRLLEIHHGKCCYCERKYPREYLHVEHFRPKGGVRQDFRQIKDELPGYYWLAYRWENLLLACHACNVKHKDTFFPLSNPADRARSHHDDVTREQSLFVDPVEQDPRLHIRYNREHPFGLTPEGRTSIRGFGLKNEELMEQRLKSINALDRCKALLRAAAIHPKDADLQVQAKKAGQDVDAAKQPDAEFSSMVIDYLEPFGL